MKKLILTLAISFSFIGFSSAQLRSEIPSHQPMTGEVIDNNAPDTEQLFRISSLQGFAQIDQQAFQPLAIFEEKSGMQFKSEWVMPPDYKYDCTQSYPCSLGLNKGDNLPHVIGKLGLQYLIEKAFR
jgi:hypothetical protein